MEHRDLLRRREALIAMGAGVGAIAGIDALWRPLEADGAGCLLQREVTEGPYYLDLDLMRRNITGNRRGAPLALTFTVVDAGTCQVIPRAIVEIWHADADGRYSGVAGVSGHWLRGGQRTDAKGRARFDTIVPGWYPGRTPHIHMKVFAGGDEVHTGQVFFHPKTLRKVYAKGVYADRGNADTSNAADSICREAGARAIVPIERAGSGWRGALTIGVQAA
jgi:protocatechuate 3,4-dioxygenase beta subunit